MDIVNALHQLVSTLLRWDAGAALLLTAALWVLLCLAHQRAGEFWREHCGSSGIQDSRFQIHDSGFPSTPPGECHSPAGADLPPSALRRARRSFRARAELRGSDGIGRAPGFRPGA